MRGGWRGGGVARMRDMGGEGGRRSRRRGVGLYFSSDFQSDFGFGIRGRGRVGTPEWGFRN